MLEDPFEYQPQPGTRFWRWTLLAWLFIVGLFGAGMVTCAQGADFSSEDQDGKLTLTKEPCKQAGPWFVKWREARWFFRGKMYDACWSTAQTRQGGQVIVVIDSDGQVSQVDPQAFKPDDGV